MMNKEIGHSAIGIPVKPKLQLDLKALQEMKNKG